MLLSPTGQETASECVTKEIGICDGDASVGDGGVVVQMLREVCGPVIACLSALFAQYEIHHA